MHLFLSQLKKKKKNYKKGKYEGGKQERKKGGEGGKGRIEKRNRKISEKPER